jgi:hypothetical protein
MRYTKIVMIIGATTNIIFIVGYVEGVHKAPQATLWHIEILVVQLGVIGSRTENKVMDMIIIGRSLYMR